ncbi:diguanylate cyclase [Paucibacter sp. R3-3]|uniref:diguanylate cyclase n=1 Tax=Roseateles agri TaxID=3098619 RepID=A0ABU5DAW9_9BURK|nr:diguanylate cyclase [Paucibacter sp. R3-3]MDY0743423.1 diguanylate cyclase [Paucibacter sp. R3-3]
MTVIADKAKLSAALPWWLLGGAVLAAADLAALLLAPAWAPALHGLTLLAGALIAVQLWRAQQRGWADAQAELAQTHQALAQARAEAQQERQLLERAVDVLPVGLEIYDEQDRLLLANRRARDWFPAVDFDIAKRPTFEQLLRQSFEAGEQPLDAQQTDVETWMQARIAQHGQSDLPLLQQWADGFALMIHERRTAEGYLVCARLDVTELVAKERALQTSQAQLQAIIGTAGVAILTLDTNGRIGSANPTTERMLGYTNEELLDQDVGVLMGETSRRLLRQDVQAYISAEDRELLGRPREVEVRHKSGRALTVQLALAEVNAPASAPVDPASLEGETRPAPLDDDEEYASTPRFFVAVLTDITERKRFEVELQHANEQLLRLSTTDSLTELANRRLLMNRLEDEWRRALRSSEPLSVLLIDVDFFKLYNDHNGHPAGDACLQTVADVLRICANRPSDLAARYGGEEFVLLLPHTDEGGAQNVAMRVMQKLREAAVPHDVSPQGPFITVSIGIVSGQASSHSSAANWLAQADLALYQAKAQGRNRLVTAPGY